MVVRVVPADDVEVVVEQTVVYLIPRTGRLVRLNGRGSQTFDSIARADGDIEAATSDLSVDWDCPTEEARRMVDQFVDKLVSRGLVERSS